MNEFDKQSSSKGILQQTVELIAACILFLFFVFIMYGIFIDDSFFNYMGDRLIELMLSFIVWAFKFIGLPIGGIKFLIWVCSGEREVVYEYNVEVKHSPITQESAANTPTEPQKAGDSIGAGETIIVTEHTDNGGIFHHTTRGSELYRQVISKNAARQTREYNDKINQKSDDLLRGHYERINRSI